MTTLRFTTSVILAAAALVTANSHRSAAMPARSLATPADIVVVACQRGEPNCLPTDPGTPEKCGGPGNPCVIDGGSDCQNASSCGTDNTGDHNLNGASNMSGVISDAKSHPTSGGRQASAGGHRAAQEDEEKAKTARVLRHQSLNGNVRE